VRGVVFICTFLFLLGVLFGYYVIAPFSISFLAGFTLEGLEVAPTLDSYVTYMTMFTIPTGFIFQMPIFRAQLLHFFPSLFGEDGNFKMIGLTATSAMFAGILFIIMKLLNKLGEGLH
jgi:hypothetical protein